MTKVKAFTVSEAFKTFRSVGLLYQQKTCHSLFTAELQFIVLEMTKHFLRKT